MFFCFFLFFFFVVVVFFLFVSLQNANNGTKQDGLWRNVLRFFFFFLFL